MWSWLWLVSPVAKGHQIDVQSKQLGVEGWTWIRQRHLAEHVHPQRDLIGRIEDTAASHSRVSGLLSELGPN